MEFNFKEIDPNKLYVVELKNLLVQDLSPSALQHLTEAIKSYFKNPPIIVDENTSVESLENYLINKYNLVVIDREEYDTMCDIIDSIK